MDRRLRFAVFLAVVFLLSLPLAAFAAPQQRATGDYYVVQAGDSLWDIAWSLGVSTYDLADVNGITDVDDVYPGEELVIPGQSYQADAGWQEDEQVYAGSTSSDGGKWIDVNLSEQLLSAYEDGVLVFSTWVSTGTEEYPTPTATYAILDRAPYQDMSGPDYYLADVPNVLAFAGNYAIHGTYWHDNFGTPMSHGCVNLPTDAAGWLYDWASIGTPVVTHY